MLLAACGGQESDAPAETLSESPASESTSAPTEADQKAFNDSFESAMQAVPPESRDDFQKYLTCEIEKNNALPLEEQAQIDAAYIRNMTAKLKADPSLAQC